jgi:hypothetical protein
MAAYIKNWKTYSLDNKTYFSPGWPANWPAIFKQSTYMKGLVFTVGGTINGMPQGYPWNSVFRLLPPNSILVADIRRGSGYPLNNAYIWQPGKIIWFASVNSQEYSLIQFAAALEDAMGIDTSNVGTNLYAWSPSKFHDFCTWVNNFYGSYKFSNGCRTACNGASGGIQHCSSPGCFSIEEPSIYLKRDYYQYLWWKAGFPQS